MQGSSQARTWALCQSQAPGVASPVLRAASSFPGAARLPPPGLLLYRASRQKHLPEMAEALAHGADVNWVHGKEDRATPLIQAVQGVSTALGREGCPQAWQGISWGRACRAGLGCLKALRICSPGLPHHL